MASFVLLVITAALLFSAENARGAAVVSTASAGSVGIAPETDKRLPTGPAGAPAWGLQPAPTKNTNLPNVLLIGDSILNAYRSTVIRELQGQANVDAWVNPYHQASTGLHEKLQAALTNGPYDVIHFNMGLHGWQKGRIPDGQFEDLTRKLVQTLVEGAPGARLIWASSTPVTAKGQPGQLDLEINPTIVEHNAMAAKVMKEGGIPVHDLYGLMDTRLDLAKGDQFHWVGEGSRIQGIAVANIIKQHLKTNRVEAAATPLALKSPNGELVLMFKLKDLGDARNRPSYQLICRGQPVMAESCLGFEVTNSSWSECWKVVGQTTTSQDATWRPVYGERSTVRDHYNQLVVELEGTDSPRRRMQIAFRAYDEGVAFCHSIPKQDGLDNVVISRENSEFCFFADHLTWATYAAQGLYQNVPLSAVKSGCERPLAIQVATNLYVALAEARLVDYARMKFKPLPGAVNGLVSHLDGLVTSSLPLQTPWRAVILAKNPGQLLENNDLILNLNDPCAVADTSWIKPGKVLREMTLTTQGGKACVEFAAKHNMQYILFDAGWYGHEYDTNSDARSVNVDPKRSKGPLDLPEVIRYAKERDIGVILYVNRRALERQLDEILPLYHSWGVKGVKYGFVNVGSQYWTRWLHAAVRKAAENHLMVDVHDEYRPTGYQRTYPNLMTAEGIRGDEEKDRSNAQSLVSQFTRYLAGPADNTICYYDPRVDQLTTHANQLAKAVCCYSPWQFLFWYDRPRASVPGSDGGDAPNIIGDEPELEFFDRVPTVWDDTKVLQGELGQHAVIARRSGREWFVGVMNADTPNEFVIPMNFLDADRRYVANIYTYDPSVATRSHVKIERISADSKTILKESLRARDGVAVRIVPESN